MGGLEIGKPHKAARTDSLAFLRKGKKGKRRRTGENRMKTIQKSGYVFSADTEKTKKHYENNTLCNCAACRNFYAQVRDAFPKLCEFLSFFGIDMKKPDEIFSADAENGVNYMEVDYTAVGRIVAMGKGNIELSEEGLHIAVSDGHVSSNEQTERYFVLSVAGIKLPRIITEPERTTKKESAPFRFGSIFRKKPKKGDKK